MKKRMFINRPDTNVRGQYTFFDDNSIDYYDSSGLPSHADKFSDKDLYSYVQENTLNDYIVKNSSSFPGESWVQIDKLNITNTGTGHRMFNVHWKVWIFDNYAWQKAWGDINSFTSSPLYSDHYTVLNKCIANHKWKVYDRYVGTVNSYGYSPGVLIEGARIMKDMNLIEDWPSDVAPGRGDVLTGGEHFEPAEAFLIEEYMAENGMDMGLTQFNPLIKPSINSGTPQTIFLVVWLQGDDKRSIGWGHYTDHRRKRLYVIPINSDLLFDSTGAPIIESFEFGHSHGVVYDANGGSSMGHQAAAFQISDFDISFSTFKSPTEEEVIDAESNLSDREGQVRSSITPAVGFNFLNLDQTILKQWLYQEIYNIQPGQDNYTNYDLNLIKSNFDPVAKIVVSDKPEYDFQSYYPNSEDSQVCSAPGKVTIDFDIAPYKKGDNDLTNDHYERTKHILGYKFYIVSWNDENNEFNTLEDVIRQSPGDFFELQEKREDNLYYYSDVGQSLTSINYSTPGIKTIKSIVVSHTKVGMIQIVRWKLVTSRIFLDIPISQYPDFAEVGGGEYNTIPWPFTTPIISGVDEDSKYYKSVKNILGGGKIGDTDILDEKFLVQALDNDELGKSINQFDLEQVRYFTTGSYDMTKLLNIEDRITDGLNFYPYTDNEWWNCSDWDGERNKCFSDETSVGEIFIGDNLDLDIKKNCELELNVGDLTGKSISDTSGKGSKGLLIGDYNIKKIRKGQSMRRDSYIRTSKKKNNKDGVL